jgi:hypothetical protein
VVDGVGEDVAVEVGVTAGEADGVLRGPAAGGGVVVAGAEADEAGVGVVEAAGEGEGLEGPAAVLEGGVAPGVVADLLHHGTGGDADDQADGAEVVGDEA